MAQDRHEIYVVIGEYDTLYIRYITGRSTQLSKSFLKMTQVGPYPVDDSSKMNRLGELLLAYIYKEFSE